MLSEKQDWYQAALFKQAILVQCVVQLTLYIGWSGGFWEDPKLVVSLHSN